MRVSVWSQTVSKKRKRNNVRKRTNAVNPLFNLVRKKERESLQIKNLFLLLPL